MSNIKTSLDQIFDVPAVTAENLDDIPFQNPTVIGVPQKPKQVEIFESSYSDIPENQEQQDDDFRKVRRNLREITEKGNILLDGIMDVAKDTDKPIAYEAAATLIKTLAEVNKDLLDIHEKNKKFRQEEHIQQTPTGGVNIDKAVFVGTMAELLEETKKLKDDES